jgi:PMC2NT (NUC016) domain
LTQCAFAVIPINLSFQNGLKQIVKATKAVNELPVHGASRDLYSAHAAFRNVMDVKSERVLELAHQLIQLQNIKGNIVRREKEEKFDLLQEYNDLMMERVNINLDDMAGYKKQAAPIIVQAELKAAMGVRRGIVNGSWNEKKISEEMLEKVQSAKWVAKKLIFRANFHSFFLQTADRQEHHSPAGEFPRARRQCGPHPVRTAPGREAALHQTARHSARIRRRRQHRVLLAPLRV